MRERRKEEEGKGKSSLPAPTRCPTPSSGMHSACVHVTSRCFSRLGCCPASAQFPLLPPPPALPRACSVPPPPPPAPSHHVMLQLLGVSGATCSSQDLF